MRRAAPLLVAGVLACTPPELAGTTGSSSGEVASSTTGEPDDPTGDASETSAGAVDTTIAASTGSSTGTGTETTTGTTGETDGETGDMPACRTSDAPGGALRWSLEGAELPGQASEIAAHLAGGVVLAGTSDPGTQHADVFVQVRDSAGALLWSDQYAGVHGLEDVVLGLAVDAEGFVHLLVRETIKLEIGQYTYTSDARLVVLRYGPDGTREWRWEREHAPVAIDETYVPDGNIGVVGDTLMLLAARHYPDPAALITLDAAGNVLADVLPVEPLGDWRSIGPHGLYFLREYDVAEIGRAGLDGVLSWTAPAPGYKSGPLAFVGPLGEVHVTWTYGGESEYLGLVEPDGTPGPMVPVALGAPEIHIDAGAVHCDGTLLLTGAAHAGGPDVALWLGRYTLAGEPLWVTDQPFGSTFSLHLRRRIVAMPDGDVLVLAPYLDPPMQQSAWLGRFAGG